MDRGKVTSAEVLIMGGGLAGLALAVQTQASGRDTLVLEKGEYPRHRVCGEYLSLESVPFLESLGVNLMEGRYPLIQNLELYARDRWLLECPLPQGALGISRYELDDLLYRRALALGARVMTGQTVRAYQQTREGRYQVEATEGHFEGRYLVDATGKNGFTPRASGTYSATKCHIERPVAGQQVSTIALQIFREGYVGYGPVEGGRLSMALMARNKTIKPYLPFTRELAKKRGLYHERLHGYWSDQPATPSLQIANFSFEAKPTADLANWVPKLGDVATQIPPLTGNGMSVALRSAYLFYTLCLEPGGTGRQVTERWVETHHNHFSQRLSRSRKLHGLFRLIGQSHLVGAAVRLLPKPAVRSMVMETHDWPY